MVWRSTWSSIGITILGYTKATIWGPILGTIREVSGDLEDFKQEINPGYLRGIFLVIQMGINLGIVQGINQGLFWGSFQATFTGQRNSPLGFPGPGPGSGQLYHRGRGRLRCFWGDPCPARQQSTDPTAENSPPPLGTAAPILMMFFFHSMRVTKCLTL